ncbi:tRNA1Val (adenine37-N6)-methyltransferase [Chitinophaga sp. YR573]|uniref:tRNA1(Val) (adenine(37)-N6)-methyltransferase n=1 Tax=Chitinophaga sp. YR573 TaxID=1881040 RepID=UPI0008D0747B|nr:methyltransferase [Chitinophaga sp. YR573]SEW45502.1 tRNA1Val (adenine37-N6)-methyltransferase [Chitinophaga sp. YR573]
MANNYFRFKEFTVYQDACAMKVCTDACIQGAYTARYILENNLPSSEIMDIGAGTGLLTLMLAQQLPSSHFTAIELDTAAAGQAIDNIAATPWVNNIKVINADTRELPVALYDFIITNPPFYETDLKSNDQLRNQAMHATTLNYTSLLEVITNHLKPDGVFSILLPYQPFTDFAAKAADAGFDVQQILHIKQSVQHDYFRSVGIFKKREGVTNIEEMAIRETGNIYTPAFTDLLKPYYLYL